jgi:hypothetical protein
LQGCGNSGTGGQDHRLVDLDDETGAFTDLGMAVPGGDGHPDSCGGTGNSADHGGAGVPPQDLTQDGAGRGARGHGPCRPSARIPGPGLHVRLHDSGAEGEGGPVQDEVLDGEDQNGFLVSAAGAVGFHHPSIQPGSLGHQDHSVSSQDLFGYPGLEAVARLMAPGGDGVVQNGGEPGPGSDGHRFRFSLGLSPLGLRLRLRLGLRLLWRCASAGGRAGLGRGLAGAGGSGGSRRPFSRWLGIGSGRLFHLHLGLDPLALQVSGRFCIAATSRQNECGE